jgi:hypothetical protein
MHNVDTTDAIGTPNVFLMTIFNFALATQFYLLFSAEYNLLGRACVCLHEAN